MQLLRDRTLEDHQDNAKDEEGAEGQQGKHLCTHVCLSAVVGPGGSCSTKLPTGYMDYAADLLHVASCVSACICGEDVRMPAPPVPTM